MQPNVRIMKEKIIIVLNICSMLFIVMSILCFYLIYDIYNSNKIINTLNQDISKLTAQISYDNKLASIAIEQASNIAIKHKTEKQICERQNIIHNPIFQMAAFLHKFYPQMPTSEKKEYIYAFVDHSIEYKIPPVLMAAICKRESNFNPNAMGKKLPSGAHAKGLCQIHPKYWTDTIREIGYNNKEDLFIIDANVYAGIKAFRYFYDTKGNVNNALTGYVGGQHPSYNYNIISTYTDFMMWLYNLTNNDISDILSTSDYQITNAIYEY